MTTNPPAPQGPSAGAASLRHAVSDPPQPAHRLRIYVGEGDKWHGKPLYEAIVLKAREMHMAGSTVLRGPMGFGANSRIHTSKILRLSEDLPMIVEIIDTPARIAQFRPHLTPMITGGLVTLEEVGVLIYSPTP